MGAKFLSVVSVICFTLLQLAASEDVVMLLHGFAGNGEDWDYEAELISAGLTTKIVVVGPFSSNYDRAAEAFAQMKGTVVDYGVCHSRQFGHQRFGTDYTGQALYPEWDENHKIDILAHSMGAQTARALEHLLREGSGCAEDTSALFTGGKKWIRSITTLAGALDGTTLVDQLGDGLVEVLRDVVLAYSVITGADLTDDNGFAQWGIVRQTGESFFDYLGRAFASPAFSSKDISTFDLSRAGARELNNAMTHAYSDTYYFGIATERTDFRRSCFLWWCWESEEPTSSMNAFLQLTANIIGGVPNVPELRKNDGVVNWLGAQCPTTDSIGKSACIQYTGSWSSGAWYWLDSTQLDHLQIKSRDNEHDNFDYATSAKKLYVEYAQRILSLPDSNQLVSSITSIESSLPEDVQRLQYLTVVTNDDEPKPIGALVGLIVGVVAFVALIALGVRRMRTKKSHNSQDVENDQAVERAEKDQEVEVVNDVELQIEQEADIGRDVVHYEVPTDKVNGVSI